MSDGTKTILDLLYDGNDDTAITKINSGERCIVDDVGDEGENALLYACKHKIDPVAMDLMEFYPEDCGVDCIDENGDTALLWACYNGLENVVMELLKHVNEETLLARDADGNDALQYIIKKGLTESAAQIFDIYDELDIDTDRMPFDIICDDGNTMLTKSIRSNNDSMTYLLLKHPGSCRLDHKSEGDLTALMLACVNGDERLLNILFEHLDKCDVDARTPDGKTALSVLCSCGPSEYAIKLINHPGTYLSGHGTEIPLMNACRTGRDEIAIELLKYPTECNMSALTDTGVSCIYYACNNGMEDVVMEMLKYPKQNYFGPHVYSDQSWSDTLIELACKRGMERVVIELLKYKDRALLNEYWPASPLASFNGYIYYTSTVLTSVVSLLQSKNMMKAFGRLCEVIDVLDALKDVHSRSLTTECIDTIRIYVKHRVNYGVKSTIDELKDDTVKSNYETLTKLEQKRRSMNRENECMMCCFDTTHNIFMSGCKHFLHVCEDCTVSLGNRCPICTTRSPVIKGCFAV